MTAIPAERAAGSGRSEPAGHDGWRLTLAGAAGTLAAVSSIGLMATSAWLISRASQHPPVLYLMVPVAAVQAFGIGRGLFRYAERLAGHDAALRILARIRMSAYDKLERLAPAGVSAFRSGDLISRLVTDVDSLTDRWLRVRLPYVVAALAGAAAVAVAAALLPAAGLVLALSLVAAALGAPLLAGAIARRAERQLAPRRGEFAAATVDLLRGAGELSVLGTSQQALQAVTDKSQQVAQVQARSAYARASGAAVSALAAGAALWGCLVLGVAGVQDGTMAGVTLAVLALMPLAVHEVFSGLAPAAQEIPRLRSASARVADVLAQPDPVTEPARPVPLPGPPYHIKVRGLTVRWGADEPDVLRGADLDLPAGCPGRRDRAERLGQDHPGHGAAAVPRPGRRDGDAGRYRHHHAGFGPGALGDRPVRPGRAHLRLHAAGEPAAGAPRAGDDELADALRRARLDDWVAGLPGGLDTEVGEHGARLSGGQRQRLALARVLLADFPVVILDEPAEHLDEPTAAALTADLLAAVAGRTVLLITHRPVRRGDRGVVPPGPAQRCRRGPGAPAHRRAPRAGGVNRLEARTRTVRP